MASGMQRYQGIVDFQLLSVGERLHPFAHPQGERQPARLCTEIGG
jgi:hypothetical protein